MIIKILTILGLIGGNIIVWGIAFVFLVLFWEWLKDKFKGGKI